MGAFLSPAHFRKSFVLSIMLAALVLVTAAAGILVPGLYRDRPFVVPVWVACNWVALLAVVPLFAVTLVLARKGSLRAVLVLLGTVYSMLYTYAFFVFGVTVNELFLVYTAVLSLSLFALVFGLASLDVDAIGERFRSRIPARWIGGYLLLVSLMVLRVWTLKWIDFVVTGQPPILDPGLNTEADYRVTAGIDISLLVGPFLLAGLWLWKRRPWGYILAVMCNVHAVLLMAALAVGCFTTFRAGMPGALFNLVIWIPLGIGSLVCLGFLLANVVPSGQPGEEKVQASHAVV